MEEKPSEMEIRATVEDEVDDLCKRYAMLQESAMGRQHGLAPFECKATLEKIGKKSSYSTQLLLNDNPCGFLVTLKTETEFVGRLFRLDDAAYTASHLRNGMSLPTQLSRVVELRSLVREAVSCLCTEPNRVAKRRSADMFESNNNNNNNNKARKISEGTADEEEQSSSSSGLERGQDLSPPSDKQPVDALVSSKGNPDEVGNQDGTTAVASFVKTKLSFEIIDIEDSDDDSSSDGQDSRDVETETEKVVESTKKPAVPNEVIELLSSSDSDETPDSSNNEEPDMDTETVLPPPDLISTSARKVTSDSASMDGIHQESDTGSSLDSQRTAQGHDETRLDDSTEKRKALEMTESSSKSDESLSEPPPPPAAELMNATVAAFTNDHSKVPRGINSSGIIQEQHKKVLYCATWSKDFHVEKATGISKAGSRDWAVSRYLATCAGACLTIYQVNMIDDPRGPMSGPFVLKQSFVDADPAESFYACAFAGRSRTKRNVIGNETSSSEASLSIGDTNMPQLLCAGGSQRRIVVIDILRRQRIMTLKGHGEDILDIKACPTDEWILLSCSEDESIRLWNLKTGSAVAVLAGREGHRDSVISVAWHPLGRRIASSGMDNTIKIWDVGDGSPVQRAIVESHMDAQDLFTVEGDRQVNPVLVDLPIFSTVSKIHIHCVDCVQFVGNLILSKSIDSVIELWCPKLPPVNQMSVGKSPVDGLVHLQSFRYKDGEVWYMRFATDPLEQRLAVGNVHGEIFLWEIGSGSCKPSRVLTTTGKSAVRCVEFSPCGNCLVACTENGSIYKWDVRKRKSSPKLYTEQQQGSETILLV